jgi:hypothetical protein
MYGRSVLRCEPGRTEPIGRFASSPRIDGLIADCFHGRAVEHICHPDRPGKGNKIGLPGYKAGRAQVQLQILVLYACDSLALVVERQRGNVVVDPSCCTLDRKDWCSSWKCWDGIGRPVSFSILAWMRSRTVNQPSSFFGGGHNDLDRLEAKESMAQICAQFLSNRGQIRSIQSIRGMCGEMRQYTRSCL